MVLLVVVLGLMITMRGGTISPATTTAITSPTSGAGTATATTVPPIHNDRVGGPRGRGLRCAMVQVRVWSGGELLLLRRFGGVK